MTRSNVHPRSNMMDKPGLKKVSDISAANAVSPGYIVRDEPAGEDPRRGVMIAACEIMGRDIGRYVKFVERFGGENESVRVIIGELRQIYMVGDGGDDITLNIGTCDPHEYHFGPNDMIMVYGSGVTNPPLTAEDEMLDNQKS